MRRCGRTDQGAVMVKKQGETGDRQGAAGLFDSALAGQVRDSAQQIWLAGMGAFAKAQAEGRQVFEALVKEGASLQQKTHTAAEDKLGDVTQKVSNLAGDMSSRAGQQWDKLESIFEERTAKALKRLGVPSSRDMDALAARIEELSAQVARLAQASAKPSTPRKTASASGIKRPAARRSSARKTE
jgi:poly(hydroxyalkanoate) granule-associated protein